MYEASCEYGKALAHLFSEMQAIMSNAPIAILFTRDRRITACNPRFYEMFGYSGHPGDAAIGAEAKILFRSEEEYAELGRLASPLLSAGKPFRHELSFRRADGSDFWSSLIGYVVDVDNPEHGGTIWLIEDHSEFLSASETLRRSRDELTERMRQRTLELEAAIRVRQRAEERARHRACHDRLTGLPNRIELKRRLRDAVTQASLTESEVAVLFIDLDRFKTINNSLGHHIGDMLLKRVAGRLQKALRDKDAVSRVGDDEFVVTLPDLARADQAAEAAERILRALRRPLHIGQHEIIVTLSIGISLYPRDGIEADALMRSAGTAMYDAKAGGRNGYRFFEPSMNTAAEQYFQIEAGLRRAVEHGEIELHYQPIVRADDGTLASLEVLVRWHHPALGLLMPACFIPVAEDSGLIGVLGDYVLRYACRQIRQWRDLGYQPPPLAVNLSPTQFRNHGIGDALVTIASESGVATGAIELEITETTLMLDSDLTRAAMKRLAELGFGLSIDDFGTGYSSLAYLNCFPVHKLKIDRSFIRNVVESENSRAIVRAVLALAESLCLKVVAEGVETDAQFTVLRELGCHYVQGYFISPPVAASEIDRRYFVDARSAVSG